MKLRSLAAAVFILAAMSVSVFAANDDNFVIYTSDEAQTNEGNLTYADGVTAEMCSAQYWKNKLGSDIGRVMMSYSGIDELNKAILDEQNTFTNDLEKLPETYSASITEFAPPNDKALYINGEPIDIQAYYDKLNSAYKATGYSGTMETEYAVVTRIADMKSIPTKDIIGYSASDADDEMQESSLNVNEPFVIRQTCVIDGERFYSGYSQNCSGWVPADCLAVCSDKDEWLDAWKVDTSASDFLVVTQDKIVLEPSVLSPETSEVKLRIGTVLKLVSPGSLPRNIAERGTWNNYVVYLPTRGENGEYNKQYALISQHYSVSVGYLPFTQGNILDTAFSCLGNRYGWGGMLDSMDCSEYTCLVYRCFGLWLPRNTTWQTEIPGAVTDIKDMTDTQKQEYCEDLHAGALLFFKGHIMIYAGSENGTAYVISDTGSLSDSTGEVDIKSMYSVILNPVTVRRKDGTTWLNNISKSVSFDTMHGGEVDADYSDGLLTVSGIGTAAKMIKVSYAEGVLENVEVSDITDGSYEVSLTDNDRLFIWRDLDGMPMCPEMKR